MSRVLVWFSCGAASAVTAKLAVEKYPDCELLYCDTLKYEHDDNLRFMKDVEKWTGKKVKILKSKKFNDIFEVFDKGWLIGVNGAACTREMKIKVRIDYQQPGDLHLFGFTSEEEKRIQNFEDSWDIKTEWLLYDNKITKSDCYRIIKEAGIEIPMMYKLGYNFNNCKCCVKGGQGYWNKIRVDFPDMFEKMAKQERKLNVAINKSYAGDGKRKRVFLDELDPKAGRDVPMPDIDCGVICNGITKEDIEFAQEQFELQFE